MNYIPQSEAAALDASHFVQSHDDMAGLARFIEKQKPSVEDGNKASVALAGHQHAGLFNSAPWQEVLSTTYGFEIKALTKTSISGAKSAVHYCLVSDMRGSRILSLPFSDYCDPLVDSLDDWRDLAGALVEQNVPVKFKLVHNELPLLDERFSKSNHELWHGTDLTLPEETLWSRLDDTAHRNIRKAQKCGVKVRVGCTLQDVRTFYGMHVHVRKSKYRLLAQPEAFFENIHHVFGQDDSILVLLAEKDGVPIAGILFLIFGDTLYYKFNASTQLEFRPNDLLIWTGMQLGKQMGLKCLDFGISALDQPGLVSFKRKFASSERKVTQLNWAPPNHQNPQGAAAGELLAALTRLLTEPSVPDELGQASSKILYRQFC